MRIETIEEMCGIPAGLVKEVPDNIGKELIERGIAKEVKEKSKPSKA